MVCYYEQFVFHSFGLNVFANPNSVRCFFDTDQLPVFKKYPAILFLTL